MTNWLTYKRGINMKTLKSEWQRLRDSYPPLEIPYDKEERTQFENWVAEMGFDGIIELNGVDNDKNKKSSKRIEQDG